MSATPTVTTSLTTAKTTPKLQTSSIGALTDLRTTGGSEEQTSQPPTTRYNDSGNTVWASTRQRTAAASTVTTDGISIEEVSPTSEGVETDKPSQQALTDAPTASSSNIKALVTEGDIPFTLNPPSTAATTDRSIEYGLATNGEIKELSRGVDSIATEGSTVDITTEDNAASKATDTVQPTTEKASTGLEAVTTEPLTSSTATTTRKDSTELSQEESVSKVVAIATEASTEGAFSTESSHEESSSVQVSVTIAPSTGDALSTDSSDKTKASTQELSYSSKDISTTEAVKQGSPASVEGVLTDHPTEKTLSTEVEGTKERPVTDVTTESSTESGTKTAEEEMAATDAPNLYTPSTKEEVDTDLQTDQTLSTNAVSSTQRATEFTKGVVIEDVTTEETLSTSIDPTKRPTEDSVPASESTTTKILTEESWSGTEAFTTDLSSEAAFTSKEVTASPTEDAITEMATAEYATTQFGKEESSLFGTNPKSVPTEHSRATSEAVSSEFPTKDSLLSEAYATSSSASGSQPSTSEPVETKFQTEDSPTTVKDPVTVTESLTKNLSSTKGELSTQRSTEYKTTEIAATNPSSKAQRTPTESSSSTTQEIITEFTTEEIPSSGKALTEDSSSKDITPESEFNATKSQTENNPTTAEDLMIYTDVPTEYKSSTRGVMSLEQSTDDSLLTKSASDYSEVGTTEPPTGEPVTVTGVRAKSMSSTRKLLPEPQTDAAFSVTTTAFESEFTTKELATEESLSAMETVTTEFPTEESLTKTATTPTNEDAFSTRVAMETQPTTRFSSSGHFDASTKPGIVYSSTMRKTNATQSEFGTSTSAANTVEPHPQATLSTNAAVVTKDQTGEDSSTSDPVATAPPTTHSLPTDAPSSSQRFTVKSSPSSEMATTALATEDSSSQSEQLTTQFRSGDNSSTSATATTAKKSNIMSERPTEISSVRTTESELPSKVPFTDTTKLSSRPRSASSSIGVSTTSSVVAHSKVNPKDTLTTDQQIATTRSKSTVTLRTGDDFNEPTEAVIARIEGVSQDHGRDSSTTSPNTLWSSYASTVKAKTLTTTSSTVSPNELKMNVDYLQLLYHNFSGLALPGHENESPSRQTLLAARS